MQQNNSLREKPVKENLKSLKPKEERRPKKGETREPKLNRQY